MGAAMSSSDSDSGGDEEKRKEKRKKREEEKKRKPKFFRDIKPEKILGVTTDPGELYFYIKWEADKAEPGLVKAREAYQKIPQMCLKFYEQHLIWNKKEEAQAEPISEPQPQPQPQPQSESTEEISISK